MDFVGPNDILVLQKDDGIVRRVQGGMVTTALDVPVNNASERGLLGIAVNSQSPPRVFLYYTEAATDGGTPLGNRIYRYTWNAAMGVLQSPQLILDLPVTPGPNHDGGVLLLGPPGEGTVADGRLLYAVIGDLNRDGQLENFPAGAAPDNTAVIVRIEQDGTAAAGNPFVPYCSGTTSTQCPTGTGCPGGQTCLSQVARYYAYGVRNSFGLALDPMTGDLWDTENGPGSYDEVNRVAAGFNSGWEQIMGPDSRDPQGVGDLFNMPGGAAAYSDPEFSWVSTVAPTGIVFPVGGALPAAYDDVALVGDNNTGQLYRFPLNAGRTGFDLSGFTGLGDLVADSTTERNAVAIG
jgi:glucose/arabinose dehydrogenase